VVVLFLALNIEITKFFLIKTALSKSEMIIIFGILVHKSFVSWNKTSSLAFDFKPFGLSLWSQRKSDPKSENDPMSFVTARHRSGLGVVCALWMLLFQCFEESGSICTALGVATCAGYWRWTLQCCDGELSSRATTHVVCRYVLTNDA